MVTVQTAAAWALTLTVFGLVAPLAESATSATDHRQTVKAKPIDPTTVQRAADAEDYRLIPLPPGVYRAGDGVSMPRVVRQVSPNYTSDAMRAEVQGVVRLACTVGVDGAVGDVRVVRSLDTLHGLDDEAVRALKLWTFEPGRKDGVPVPVQLIVESTFSMSAAVRPTKTRR
jgi:TonB family protein